jgi:hypothetical protein
VCLSEKIHVKVIAGNPLPLRTVRCRWAEFSKWGTEIPAAEAAGAVWGRVSDPACRARSAVGFQPRPSSYARPDNWGQLSLGGL